MLSALWFWCCSSLFTPCVRKRGLLTLLSFICALASCKVPEVFAAQSFSLAQIQAERIELDVIATNHNRKGIEEIDRRILNSADNPTRLAALYLLKANLSLHQGLPAIEENLAKATPLIDEKKQPELYLFAMVIKSYGLYMYQNQAAQAAQLLEQLQRHPALHHDVYVQVGVLSNLLEVYYALKQFDKISKPLFKLVKVLSSQDISPYSQSHLSEVDAELAYHSGLIGDTDQAIAIYTKLLERYEVAGWPRNMAIVNCNMANMYFLPMAEKVQYARASLAADADVPCSDVMEKLILLDEIRQGNLANSARLSKFSQTQQMPTLNERSAYYAGLAFLHLNDIAAVEQMINMIKDPENWEADDLRRQLYQQQGDYQKALAASQRYYELRAQKDKDARALMLNSYQTRLELAQQDTKAAEQAKQAEQLAAAEQKAAARLQVTYTVIGAGLLVTLILAMYLHRSRQLQQKLQLLSDTDPLTGLLNRRAFLREAEQLKRLALRQHFPLSLALIDLDFFKKINDQHGHQVGDAVLRAFADAAKATLRQTDIVGRFGGEEFILATAQQDCAAVAALLQRLQHSFVQLCQQDKHIRFNVSFSAGIAKLIDPDAAHEQKIEESIRQADQQLYCAKANGRQQVCTATLCVLLQIS